MDNIQPIEREKSILEEALSKSMSFSDVNFLEGLLNTGQLVKKRVSAAPGENKTLDEAIGDDFSLRKQLISDILGSDAEFEIYLKQVAKCMMEPLRRKNETKKAYELRANELQREYEHSDKGTIPYNFVARMLWPDKEVRLRAILEALRYVSETGALARYNDRVLMADVARVIKNAEEE